MRCPRSLSSPPLSPIHPPAITNVFDRAPQLHSYEATDVIFVDSLIKLPWGQLQRFTTDHIRLNMNKVALGPGPTPSIILQCSLRLEYGSKSALPTVACTRLSSLRITAWPYTIAHATRQLITHLILPSLTKLVMKNETLVLRMVQISAAPLTVLHYDKGDVNEQDLIGLLKATPLLADLRLTNIGTSGVTDHVLCALSHGGSMLVPRLHTLYLSGALGFDGSLFAKMVHLRWSTAPFKCINMRWSCKYGSGLRHFLKGTVESSLSVYGSALELSIVI
ncbi:hypothetical protein BDZ89DRAFT_1078063 [Hymenopellis radicata]|nr:hypothetical protein BDZ89DRAFT_1078063 [Hymenopellis radicata]